MAEIKFTLSEATRKLLDPATWQVIAQRAAERAVIILKERVTVYPDEGPYNQPGPYPKRWYQRLFGPRWALKGGGTNGRNTSQRLQQNWRVDWTGPTEARIYTKVTYAHYVMGGDQTWYHAAHGWKTTAQIANEFGPELVDIVYDEIDKAIK